MSETPQSNPSPDQPAATEEEISSAPAPELAIDDAEPVAPAVPDLVAVEPELPGGPTAGVPSLDLPSIKLPNPAPAPAPAPTPAPPYAPSPYQQPTGYAQQAPYQQQPPYQQPPAHQQLQPMAYPTSMGQLNPTEENTWATAAHWSAIVASFAGVGFLGPLLVLLIQGPKSARVRANAVESLNFEITFIISMIASAFLLLLVVGIVGLIAFPIVWLVLRIIASVATSGGQDYRYPVNIRLVK